MHLSTSFAGFVDANFERDTSGVAPAGWRSTTQTTAGSSVLVLTAQSVTGNKSVELRTTGAFNQGISSFSRLDWGYVLTGTDVYTAFHIKLTHNAGQQFRFLLMDSSQARIGRMQVLFRNGKIVAQYGPTTFQEVEVLSAFETDVWYEVQIRACLRDNVYSVSVIKDGVLIGEALRLPNIFNVIPSGLCFVSDGWLSSGQTGQQSVFIDNVVFSGYNAPDLNFDHTAPGAALPGWSTSVQSSSGSDVAVLATPPNGNCLSLQTGGAYNTGISSASVVGGVAYQPPALKDAIRFSISLSNAATQQCRILWQSASGAKIGNMQVLFQNGKIVAQYGLTTLSQTILHSGVLSGTWYDVEIVREEGQDAYAVKVWDAGVLIVNSGLLANLFSRIPETVTFAADGFTVSGQVGVQNVYLDDIEIGSPLRAAREYVVSTSGSDNNPGTVSQPWRSLSYAIKMARPGDTVVFENGTYTESQFVQVVRSFGFGTATRPITFKARNPWLATLSFQNVLYQKFKILQSYVSVEDFTVTQDTPHPLRADGITTNTEDILLYCADGSYGCSFLGNQVYGAFEEGIKAYKSDELLISDNVIYNMSHEGIDVMNSYNVDICHNHLDNNRRVGILAKGGIRNVRIFNNVVKSSVHSDCGIYLGGSSGSGSTYDTTTSGYELYHGVAFNNAVISTVPGRILSGITIMGARDASIFNNVVVGAATGITVRKAPGAANGWAWDSKVKNAQILNNVVMDSTVAAASVTTADLEGTFTLDYNLFYNSSSVPSQSHAISGDPMFVDKLSDWHLLAGSPARDSGTSVSNPNGFRTGDKLDVSRDFVDTMWLAPRDLGIYEE